MSAQNVWHGSVETSTDTLVPIDHHDTSTTPPTTNFENNFTDDNLYKNGSLIDETDSKQNGYSNGNFENNSYIKIICFVCFTH